MKRFTKFGTALLCALSLVGCVRFSTYQTDISNESQGTRIITTKASSTAVFSSKSDLARWKASQTDKTQGAEVGGLSQQGGTNTAQILKNVEGIIKASLPP